MHPLHATLSLSDIREMESQGAYYQAIQAYAEISSTGSDIRTRIYAYCRQAECYRQLLATDPDALNKMHQALTSARVLVAALPGSDSLRANWLHISGSYHLIQNSRDSARMYYEQALAIRQAIYPPYSLYVFESYNNLALVAYYSDFLSQSHQFYQNAIFIARHNTSLPPDRVAALYQNYGELWFYQQQLDSALWYWQQEALPRYRQLTHTQHIFQRTALELKVIHVLMEAGDIQATQALLDTVQTRIESPDAQPLLQLFRPDLLLELANYNEKTGEHELAMGYLKQAQYGYSQAGGAPPETQIQILERLAGYHVQEGRYAEGIAFIRSAIEIAKQTSNIRNQAALRLSLAQAYRLKHDQDSMVYWLDQIRVLPRFNFKNFPDLHAKFLCVEAHLYDSSRFINGYRRAISLFSDSITTKHPDIAIMWFELAQYLQEDSAYADALQALKTGQQTLYLCDQQPGQSCIISYPVLLTLMNFEANILAETGQYQAATQVLLRADSLLGVAVRQSLLEDSRHTLRMRTIDLYETALNVCYMGWVQDQQPVWLQHAVFFMEKQKARLLVERSRDVVARSAARDIPEDVWQEEQRLLSQLARLQHALTDTNYAQRLAITTQITITQKQHINWISRIEKEHPAYYRLKYDDNPISLQEVQAMLGAEEGFLSYFWTHTHLFSVLIRQDKVVLTRTDIDSAATSQLLTFQSTISNKYLSRKSPSNTLPEFIHQNQQVSRILWEPVKGIATGLKRLCILPDGPVGYIPFDVLLTEDVITDTDSYAHLPYMIRQTAISYAYAMTLLLRGHRVKASDIAYMGFAPDYTYIANAENLTNRGEQFIPLTFAKDEVESAYNLLGGERYSGREATEAHLVQSAHNPAVLHLAMHALTSDQYPLKSRLIFSQQDANSDLNLPEVYQLKPQSQLVIISACHSASGLVQRGEGIISLSRAFLYAGSPSVLASLWLVDDEASLLLMKKFLEYLHQKLPIDQALQQSKLQYLAEADKFRSHPFYWASFVQYGTSAPIVWPAPWYWQAGWLSMFVVLIIAGISGWVYIRRHT
ncbi:MAG: CHAT domain-containing tetratricopeptide repeat protein [Bacteroidia bacterium]|nr:CHAT domain-containing tetratricopeptide repeat protein [Bacteroidia bacterium]